MIHTAILVDGAFYRKRAYNLYGDKTPSERAKELSSYCHRHIKEEKDGASLYRVFYYDCPPSGKHVYHPLLKRSVDLSRQMITNGQMNFYQNLNIKENLLFVLDD